VTLKGLRVLGITGPIGCGKSTVANLTRELGAVEVIDADRIVHDLMGPGTSTAAAIASEFGPEVLEEDGSVNRPRLGQIVFNDRNRMAALEALTHPEVTRWVRRRLDELAEAGTTGVVTIEAVRLLESQLVDEVDGVWLVSCSPATQMERLTSLRGHTAAEAERRIQASPKFSPSARFQRIWNDGTLEGLETAVRSAWLATQEVWGTAARS